MCAEALGFSIFLSHLRRIEQSPKQTKHLKSGTKIPKRESEAGHPFRREINEGFTVCVVRSLSCGYEYQNHRCEHSIHKVNLDIGK